MEDKKLTKYVQEQSAAGIVPNEIKKALREAGWGDSDIDEAFASAISQTSEGAIPPVPPGKPAQTKNGLASYAEAKKRLHRKKLLIALLIAIPLLLLGIALGYYFLFR